MVVGHTARPRVGVNLGMKSLSEQHRIEFETLYAQHSREVWAVAYARWLDSELASDIAQEAFLRLWRQWEQGEDIQNPRAWLMRVARNLTEDYVKSAFRRNGTQPPQVFDGVKGSDDGPLELMEQDETAALVRELMKELSTDDRTILTYRYALDYDAQKIADELGINVSAVHMRLSRARQRLAERLTAQGVTENR